MSNNTEKRSRTSPRKRAFDEVLEILGTDGMTVDVARERVVALADSVGVDTGTEHYVGLLADGGRVHFRATGEVSQASHGGRFKGVFGPFNTKRGAEYRVANGTMDTDTVVF